MKTTVILIALFGLVLVSSNEYSHEPCELLKVDAVFVTTATEDSKSTTTNLSTNNASYATGSCSDTTSKLMVNFNETGAKWTLTFSLSAQKEVNLNMVFQYNADKMFPDQNMTGLVVLSPTNKLTLSTSDKSFKCNADQTVEFKPYNSSDVIYTLTLNMRNLQVQAFNLTDNKTFSDATECEQDGTSTEASTPTMTTSEENSTSTSMETTTEPATSEKTTTEAITTTEAPKAPINTYMLKDGNETCLIMQAALVLTVTYNATNNATKTKELAVPTTATATATGVCAEGNETNANLTIKFDSITIEFMFMDKEKKADIEEIIVTVMLDNKTFPDARTVNETLRQSKKEAIVPFDDSSFYLCHAPTMVKFDADISLEMTEVKVQAYNLKEGNFSGDGTECTADTSTSTATSPATSPATTPKPSPPPGLNNFSITDGNTTCLLMQASLVLDITYTTKEDKSKTMKVNVPVISNSSVTGQCLNVSEELTVKFFDDAWMITFTFQDTDGVQLSDDGSLGAEVKNYALMNVSVTYAFDENLPDAKDNGTVTAATTSALNQFKGSVDGSYKCHADTTVKVDKDVTLTVSDFQYQAFQTGNSKEFNKGDLTECDADTETNSVVPIAVGAALAGLVVIVLIAYLIGRRKSRRAGYESV